MAALLAGLFAGGAAYWSTRTAVHDQAGATADALNATRRMFPGAPPVRGALPRLSLPSRASALVLTSHSPLSHTPYAPHALLRYF